MILCHLGSASVQFVMSLLEGTGTRLFLVLLKAHLSECCTILQASTPHHHGQTAVQAVKKTLGCAAVRNPSRRCEAQWQATFFVLRCNTAKFSDTHTICQVDAQHAGLTSETKALSLGEADLGEASLIQTQDR